MGWTNSYLHQFILQDKSLQRSPYAIAGLMNQGRWDEIRAASRGIRIFVSGRNPFGEPIEMDGEDEHAVTLAEVCPKGKSKLTYEYDFGDGWEYTIAVQKIAPENSKPGAECPRCLAGKLACPPEDCGGVYGYYNMLEAIADPNHDEHEDDVEWMGDGFDPEALELDEVNDILADWRNGQAQRKLRMHLPRDGA